MSSAPADFDSLARWYRALEFLAFGRALERTRFALLDRLAGCRSILVLGEGDGRCLVRLLQAAPAARVHCVDASAGMLRRTAARLSGADRRRVTLELADATGAVWPAATFDAVVTLFFLDCFDAPTAARLIESLGRTLQSRALWLFADFAVPPAGPARWRAQAWLIVLYAFFRWRTGLATRRLPPAESLIGDAGFTPRAARSFQSGLLRTVLFERPAPDRPAKIVTY